MSTRGLYGFRSKGVDKLQYENYSSAPLNLGTDFISGLKRHFEGKEGNLFYPLIDEWQSAMSFLQSVPYIEEQYPKNMYCFLNSVLKFPQTQTFHNSRNFLTKCGCEWVYIVNLDTTMFEIYRGGNQNENAEGRYAWIPENEPELELTTVKPYYGPALVATYGLYRLLTELDFQNELRAVEELYT